MANDTYVQSNFNPSVWIRRDDINGQQNDIDIAQIKGTLTLPTDVGRFNKGCQLIIVDSGAEYNNISDTDTPNWVEVGADKTLAANGIYLDGTTVKLGTSPLVENTSIDIAGHNLFFSGDTTSGTRTAALGINEFIGVPGEVIVGSFMSYNDGADDFNQISGIGDVTDILGSPLGGINAFFSPTSSRSVNQGYMFDDGNGNGTPSFYTQVLNDAGTFFSNLELRSSGGGGGYAASLSGVNIDGSKTSRMRLRDTFSQVLFESDNGADIRQGDIQAQEFVSYLRSTEELSGGSITEAKFETRSDSSGYAEMSYNPDSSTITDKGYMRIDSARKAYIRNIEVINGTATVGQVPVLLDTTTGEIGYRDSASGSLPAFDDDVSAGVAGLTTGEYYQTTGFGAAPLLNVAGIVMIKQ